MLDMPHSFVCKYEQGERRLDVVELFDICEKLDADVYQVIDQIIEIKP